MLDLANLSLEALLPQLSDLEGFVAQTSAFEGAVTPIK